ncbi:MAG: right-handed parallel beta-helix repeat-containing protein [Candidatus Binatia bacterium]
MRHALALLMIYGLLDATVVFGRTLYVDGSCAQGGNGTTTTCGTNGPFKGLTNAACSGAGGVIEIRGGTYRPGASWIPSSACSGTPGNPQIIQNYAGEDVIIEGSKEHVGAGETWTEVATGVWRSSAGAAGFGGSQPAAQFPFGGWYKATAGGAEEYVYLVSKKSATSPSTGTTFTCDGTIAAGQMTYDGPTQRLCVHLSSGGNPVAGASFTTPSVFELVDLYDGVSGCNNSTCPHDITFRRHPNGGSLTFRRAGSYLFELTNNANITWDGLILNGTNNRLISQTGQPTGNRLLNSTLSQCLQDMIHWQDVGQFVIENNDFSDSTGSKSFPYSSPSLNGTGDACAVMRINGGPSSGQGIIRGNVLHNNSGGGYYSPAFCRGIDAEAGLRNVLIENNLIYQTAAWGHQGMVALPIDGASPFNNLVYRNNRVYNVDVMVQFNDDGGSQTGSGNVFYNNTFVNWATAGVNLRSGGNIASTTFANNIFLKASGNARAFNGSTSTPRPTSNVFYCPGCSGTNNLIAGWGGGNAVNTQASLDSYRSGNVFGDPKIDISGAVPSLRLADATSSAVDRGQTETGFSTDFEGTLRPQSGAWDIGADELGAGTAAPSPPTLIGVDPVP